MGLRLIRQNNTPNRKDGRVYNIIVTSETTRIYGDQLNTEHSHTTVRSDQITAYGYENAQSIFERKLDLAAMQMVINTAMAEHKSWTDYLPPALLEGYIYEGRSSIEIIREAILKTDKIHMNITEDLCEDGEADIQIIHRVEVYNVYGSRITVMLMEV